MQIEDDLGSEGLWHQRAEDQNIGHIVDMHEVVTARDRAESKLGE